MDGELYKLLCLELNSPLEPKLQFFVKTQNTEEILNKVEKSFNVTVVLKRESKWHNLWSKWPISDLVFYNIKMPPCSGPLGSTLQLTGALKWGTVWTSSSTGTGIMKGQSWTFVFY